MHLRWARLSHAREENLPGMAVVRHNKALGVDDILNLRTDERSLTEAQQSKKAQRKEQTFNMRQRKPQENHSTDNLSRHPGSLSQKAAQSPHPRET